MDFLKYEQFSSSVEPDFWYILEKKKLEDLKLDKASIPIVGFYNTGTQYEKLSSRFRITRDSFTSPSNLTVDIHTNVFHGSLLLTNTMEEFKKISKKEMLYATGNKVVEGVINGEWVKNSSKILNKFVMVCYGDLKKHLFYYYFGFPAAKKRVVQKKAPVPISTIFSEVECSKISKNYFDFQGKKTILSKDKKDGMGFDSKSFFLMDDSFTFHDLSSFGKVLSSKPKKLYFCFNDCSSSSKHPGWVIRNYLLALNGIISNKKDDINILAVRVVHGELSISISLSFSLNLNSVEEVKLNKSPDTVIVGWEKKVKFANISKMMDPVKLASSSVSLNLQLMKWRMFPALDLKKLAETKCLIVGSGTLGCYVSRALLAWGVHNISLIDRSKVSYSNPVRQPLYEFSDCLKGGKDKAKCAAEALRRIYPKVNAKGYNINIPMPGHFFSKEEEKEVEKNISMMEKLVDEHDVIFLLTDTRESRWLPSLLGCFKRKIVINAALGFDTFLVMRHGVLPEKDDFEKERLGCYFCFDVVAPVNSTKDRTLDQQCTVTRPAVAAMAASLSVEMMINILHHSKGKYSKANESLDLGIVPHQLRGSLSNFQILTLEGRNYPECTCCSKKVLLEYKKDKNKFLKKVFNDPTVLEEITGLKALHEKTQRLIESMEIKEKEEKKEVTSDDEFELL